MYFPFFSYYICQLILTSPLKREAQRIVETFGLSSTVHFRTASKGLSWTHPSLWTSTSIVVAGSFSVHPREKAAEHHGFEVLHPMHRAPVVHIYCWWKLPRVNRCSSVFLDVTFTWASQREKAEGKQQLTKITSADSQQDLCVTAWSAGGWRERIRISKGPDDSK